MTVDRQSYLSGERAANVTMLSHLLDALGSDDPAAGRTNWILERHELVVALRKICDEFGDNDWSDDLCLADVVEKHLSRHLLVSLLSPPQNTKAPRF